MKNNFIRISLILILVVLGCSKDNNSENDGEVGGFDYFIRFKANGESKEYKFVIVNNVPATSVSGSVNVDYENPINNENGYQSMISMLSNANNSEKIFLFTIFTEARISENVNYTEENTSIMAASFNDGVNFYSSDDESPDLEIVWTSISDSEARGKFSGVLYDENDSPLEVTNGEFYVLSNNSL